MIHTEKKVQSCLAECQCILGQVWCDEKTKHKKQQLPISQRRDNKKIWNSQGRVEKSQIKKSPMTSLLSQHFVQYSVIFIWGLFTYKVAKKKSKRKWEKTKTEDKAKSWKLLRISPRHFKRDTSYCQGWTTRGLRKRDLRQFSATTDKELMVIILPLLIPWTTIKRHTSRKELDRNKNTQQRWLIFIWKNIPCKACFPKGYLYIIDQWLPGEYFPNSSSMHWT